MKKLFTLLVAIFLGCSLILTGCGENKTGSSQEAIDYAKTLATVQEQTTYLVGQAKAFYNSKEFQNAVDTTQYVLRYLDKDNPQAEQLLAKAKESITAQLKLKAEETKKKFGF